MTFKAPVRASASNACGGSCVWCGSTLQPRKTGGKPKRFCSRAHAHAYSRSLWRIASEMARAGLLILVDGQWHLTSAMKREYLKTCEPLLREHMSVDENSPDKSSTYAMAIGSSA